jgi:GNAT superfamily N-acetyltransferase
MKINYREAQLKDIPQMQVIRHAVKENILSDPSLVTDEDCNDYINRKGKGWVAESENIIIGFSIVDVLENNVWALFVNPDFEGMGIGKELHDIMINWYFKQTKENIWLGTEPKTKAEKFYRKNGWKEIGRHGKGEIKFEMDLEDWKKNNQHT